MFLECLRGVSRKFQQNFQSVSKKFHVAWHSSQLYEQKEGLFILLEHFFQVSYEMYDIVFCSRIHQKKQILRAEFTGALSIFFLLFCVIVSTDYILYLLPWGTLHHIFELNHFQLLPSSAPAPTQLQLG